MEICFGGLIRLQLSISTVIKTCPRLDGRADVVARSGDVSPIALRGQKGCTRTTSIAGMNGHYQGENHNLLSLYINQALIAETEDLLNQWKHPEPHRPISAPGGMLIYVDAGNEYMEYADNDTGTKYERNLPAPILDRESIFSGTVKGLLIIYANCVTAPPPMKL